MSSESRLPKLAVLYQQYLEDQDSDTFTSESAKSYTQGTMERLAEHELPLVRRAAVLGIGFLGDYDSNTTMGHSLLDDDRTVRLLAENGIRNVWTRIGNEQQRRQLGLVIRLNTGKHYESAVRQATELIEKAPWMAEAWNQRAVARFALEQHAESIRDCHQALEINPYHFAAASGMGYAYLELNNQVSALESFRRALLLNPSLEGVRTQITRLTRMIEDK